MSNKFQSLSFLEDNSWEIPKKKSRSKSRKTTTNQQTTKQTNDAAQHNTRNHESTFENADSNENYRMKHSEIISKIIEIPITTEEYKEAHTFVQTENIRKYSDRDEPYDLEHSVLTKGEKALSWADLAEKCEADEEGRDWYAEVEAFNLARDKRLKAQDSRPVFSQTFCGTSTIPSEEEEERGKEKEEAISEEISLARTSILPHRIALVEKFEVDGVETTKVCAVMNTIFDYWCCINALTNDTIGSVFECALNGSEADADRMFKNLLNSQRNGNIQNEDISATVNKYNKLHPTWYFVRIAESVESTDTIELPFIRDNKGMNINDVTINLKEVRKNIEDHIYVTSRTFDKGYIPLLVLNFIGAHLPDYITAIAFSKTIARRGTYLFKGYRVRALTDSVEAIEPCKKFFGNDNKFNNNSDNNNQRSEVKFNDLISSPTCDYTKCIVSVSIKIVNK